MAWSASARDEAACQSEGEGAQSGLKLVEALLELVLGRVSFGLEERGEKAGGEGLESRFVFLRVGWVTRGGCGGGD